MAQRAGATTAKAGAKKAAARKASGKKAAKARAAKTGAGAKKAVARTAAKTATSKKAAAKKAAAKVAPAKKVAKKAAAKKAAGKKTAAKKGAKKTGAKKRARPTTAKTAPVAPRAEGIEALVYRLITAAAERGLGVVYGALGDAALAEVESWFGKVELPASYRRFMASFGSLRVLGDDGEVEGLCVFTPAEVARVTRGVVRVPAGVRWKDEQGRPCTITTDHLIAFADGPRGCVWCFDASAAAGELPVVAHDQDEPIYARDVETGASMTDRPPHYPDFMAWLAGQVEAFCAPPRRRRH